MVYFDNQKLILICKVCCKRIDNIMYCDYTQLFLLCFVQNKEIFEKAKIF